ncbi:MAG TPA: hypothetical protein VHF01_04965 [Candidatus Acidoferrum sp.]|nr:hypothetical protein [Candidatus Acidoferrum sp.]
MTFLEVLESIGKFAVVTGLLAWLTRSIVTQLLARDLEKYKLELTAAHSAEVERLKADLRAAAFEHETRFSQLHEERGKVIAELYKQLATVDTAFKTMLPTLSWGRKLESEQVTKASLLMS